MAVGKGSILRASNANAAVKEKKTAKEQTVAEATSQAPEKPKKAEETKQPKEASTLKKADASLSKVTDVAAKVPDMVTKVPVDVLKSVPKTWSVPVIDEARLTSLKESIRTYGMLMPILVYKNKKQELLILKGNHRVAAAKAAGLSEVPVAFIEASTDARAKEIYGELRSFEKGSETEKEYEVVSAITVNVPSYLL